MFTFTHLIGLDIQGSSEATRIYGTQYPEAQGWLITLDVC